MAQKVQIAAVQDGIAEPDTWRTMQGSAAQETSSHPDSRFMVFLSNGDLLQSDDGGIYRLEHPNDEAQRRWVSLNAGLRVAEISFSLAWDPVTNTVLAGSQDNGVIEQLGPDSTAWKDVSGGDGFFVAVGKNGENSVRYFISNTISTMERHLFSTGGAVGDPVHVKLASSANGSRLSGIDDTVAFRGATDLDAAFRAIPMVVNSVEPARLLFGRVFLYESADGSLGDVIAQLNDPKSGKPIYSLAYGGRFEGQPVPEVIYAARGDQISVRYLDASKAQVWRSANPPGADLEKKITGVAMDPANWMSAFAVDASHVWVTPDGGVTWNDLTLNLGRITGMFRTVEVVRHGEKIAVLVGASDGVYRLLGDDSGLDYGWTRFGDNLPNVRVADIAYSEEDDMLVVGATGRGVWKMSNAKAQLFKEAILRVEGTAGDDEFLIRLQDSETARPSMIELLHQGNLLTSVPLKSVLAIEVHGGDGNDRLILDNTNGSILVAGNVQFDGGNGVDDRLRFQGNYSGELLLRPLGSMDERRLDDQLIKTTNVESFFNAGLLRSLAETTRDGLRDLADWSKNLSGENLLGRVFPIFGDSFGSALNGRQLREQPVGGVRGISEAEAAQKKKKGPREVMFAEAGSAILRRLFETGTGAFLLDDIGRTLTTAEEIRQAFDDLDGTAGNVTVFTQSNETRFDITIQKRIHGQAAVDIEALDGLIELDGLLEVGADVALHLVLGVDAFGFYVDAAAVAGPELVLSGLGVKGMKASGRFGFLEVELTKGTLTTDASVAIEVRISEPGPDAYSGQADGRIRLWELTEDADSIVQVTVTGNGTQDLAVVADFKVGVTTLGGQPLFDIGTATVKLTWPDINNPFRVRVEAMGGPAEILTRFLNFRPNEVIGELRRMVNYLRQMSSSALLDVKLPFGGGVTVGASFDFSTAFIDDLFGKIARTSIGALPGFGGGLSAELSLGRLSADARFNIQIGNATPVPITVTVAAMSGNTSLFDLAGDINAALTTAGLSTQVHAAMEGNEIVFQLLQGANLKVTGDSSNPFFSELGFSTGQIGIELPRLPTLQQLITAVTKSLEKTVES